MATSTQSASQEDLRPCWARERFWITIVLIGAVLALVLTGHLTLTPELLAGVLAGRSSAGILDTFGKKAKAAAVAENTAVAVDSAVAAAVTGNADEAQPK